MGRLFFILILVSLGLLYARLLGLFARRTSTTPKLEWALDWQAKLAWQRTNLAALMGLVILGTLTEQLPRGAALLAIIGAALNLTIPVRYGFSADGITINKRLLRSWLEFESFEIRGRRLVFRGRNRFNYLAIFTPRDRRKQETITKFAKRQLAVRAAPRK